MPSFCATEKHHWVLTDCVSMFIVIPIVVLLSWSVCLKLSVNDSMRLLSDFFNLKNSSVENKAIDFVTFSCKSSIVKFSLNLELQNAYLCRHSLIFWKNLKGVRWSSAILMECKYFENWKQTFQVSLKGKKHLLV